MFTWNSWDPKGVALGYQHCRKAISFQGRGTGGQENNFFIQEATGELSYAGAMGESKSAGVSVFLGGVDRLWRRWGYMCSADNVRPLDLVC